MIVDEDSTKRDNDGNNQKRDSVFRKQKYERQKQSPKVRRMSRRERISADYEKGLPELTGFHQIKRSGSFKNIFEQSGSKPTN